MYLRNDKTLKSIKVVKTKKPLKLFDGQIWDYPYFVTLPFKCSRMYLHAKIKGGSFFYFINNGQWWKGRIEPHSPSGHTYDVCLNELLRESMFCTFSIVKQVS